jgi:hypothetical protein
MLLQVGGMKNITTAKKQVSKLKFMHHHHHLRPLVQYVTLWSAFLSCLIHKQMITKETKLYHGISIQFPAKANFQNLHFSKLNAAVKYSV